MKRERDFIGVVWRT